MSVHVGIKFMYEGKFVNGRSEWENSGACTHNYYFQPFFVKYYIPYMIKNFRKSEIFFKERKGLGQKIYECGKISMMTRFSFS